MYVVYQTFIALYGEHSCDRRRTKSCSIFEKWSARARVDFAYEGIMGEKLAFSNDYQIILLDVIIPGINGLSLCKRIKDNLPDIPILMLTALNTTDDKVTGFDAGADDHTIATPTLLIWGLQDRVTPPGVALEFHDHLPYSK